MNRTNNNNELRLSHVGQTVQLRGWVAKTRNLGGVLFIDLRDKEGITQIVVNPNASCYEIANSVKNEYVIHVEGQVIERSNKNKNIPTGDIEIDAKEVTILNTALPVPISTSNDSDALEDTRLKYRYLDLRRPVMQNFMIKRHQIKQNVRNYLENQGFMDLETPILSKSTPEGAREYLVPSRLYPGEFYSLPQSPQVYKQLFMISGMEKYYQIARCFRDEDLRSDRQPEFTQIDIEASFVDAIDIQNIIEGLLKQVFKNVLNIDIPTPFRRMDYDVAMNKYGSDKPDLRFGFELQEFNKFAKLSEFPVYKEETGVVKFIKINNSQSLTRKNIDVYAESVKKYGVKTLAYIRKTDNVLSGSIVKYFNEETLKELETEFNIENNDLLLIVNGKLDNVNNALGALRGIVARQLNLVDNSKYEFLWVVNWPLYLQDEETGRLVAATHPFTSPNDETKHLLATDPTKCIAKAYDIILNGYELGGGSIRIHDQDMQAQMFKNIGLSDDDIKNKFGFFTEALKYGTPPHGGIALGLDRLTMLVTKTENIKDVVAFPKTQSASDLMMITPSPITDRQLEEVHLKVKNNL